MCIGNGCAELLRNPDGEPLPPDDETDTGRRVYWDSFGMHFVDEESEDEGCMTN